MSVRDDIAASLETRSGESARLQARFLLDTARKASSRAWPGIQLYTTAWCGFCVRAKALLEERDLPYEEIRMDDDPAFRAKLLDLTGR